MKIAVVQKCPSNINYEKQFKLTGLEIFNLSSTKVPRLLKRDIDLAIVDIDNYDPEDPTQFCSENYDYVLLIGSEALKMFTKATAVTDYSGRIAPGKNGETNFIASISPAMLAFKPENKPVFEQTVQSIQDIITVGEVSEKEGDYQFFNEVGDCRNYLFSVLDNPEVEVVGLDSETSALACRDGYILGISVSHAIDQGVYMDADALDDSCIKLLQQIIDKKRTVFHNAKFDMHFFKYHLGLFFEGRDVHDTMIIHYLLDERQGTHGLKSLTMQYGTLGDYDRELDEFKKTYCSTNKITQAQFSYDLIPWDIIKLYAAKDTDATLALYFKFYPVLYKNKRLLECYNNMMLPALHFLTRMEDRGVPISKDRLEYGKQLLVTELEMLEAELYTFPEINRFEEDQGKVFNPASTIQLRKLLFDYIKLIPTGKLTGTGAISTDAEVLKELGETHPIPKLILDIRQKNKLKNTYIDKLLPVIDRDQRVRTGFNLTSTTSGRLSSSGKFNMQQLPRDNPIIKGCIKAPKGYRIVASDLTTAEVYYAAVLSMDKALQQVFINMRKDPKKYPDFHSNIAHMVFGLKCNPAEVKKLYPALRQAAKAVTFGIMYGSGPKSVAEQVNLALMEAGQAPTCDVDTAKGYIATYFTKFPQLKRWIDSCHAQIRAEGFIYNHFGRKRRLHNINSADRGIASGEVRSGFNAIIQSVSSDHLLLGAIDADAEIMTKGLDVEIFALVHDSVVAVVREDLVEEYREILYRHIQTDRGCSIEGVPVGIEDDSEPGGSADYSCGKLDKMFPEMAAI